MFPGEARFWDAGAKLRARTLLLSRVVGNGTIVVGNDSRHPHPPLMRQIPRRRCRIGLQEIQERGRHFPLAERG